MKLRDLRWVLFIPLICGILSCSQKEVTLGDLEVIPLPNEVSQVNDGTSFVIDESTTICYPEGNEKMKEIAYPRVITITINNLILKMMFVMFKLLFNI